MSNGATGDLLTFVQMIAFGVVGFGIIILTARSILTAINKGPVNLSIAAGPNVEIATAGANPGLSPPLPDGSEPGDGTFGGAAEEADDLGVQMTRVQGKLKASSLRKVTQLVDMHPDATLAIIRSWIATDTK